jgi:hypothetical protein
MSLDVVNVAAVGKQDQIGIRWPSLSGDHGVLKGALLFRGLEKTGEPRFVGIVGDRTGTILQAAFNIAGTREKIDP